MFVRKKALSVLLAVAVIASTTAGTALTASAASAASTTVGVTYQVHGQSYGWSQGAKANGAEAGTENKAKRLEAIKINLTGNGVPAGASITYQVHGQSYGWSQGAKSNGVTAGTTGCGKRLEAVKITLSGMPGYAVSYRVYQQTYRWSLWVTTADGTSIAQAGTAGVTGKAKRIEAIEIIIVNTAKTASVGTAQQLAAALSDSSISEIDFTADITASPKVTRPITIAFGSHTLTGDLNFSYTAAGVSALTGNAGKRISGDLTVDTPNASFDNGVQVGGKVNVENVKIGTWVETVSGNTLVITDPDGISILVEGSPDSITFEQNAGGAITLTVAAGAKVESITSNAKVNITVAAGAAVNSITAAAGSDGSTITNNGSVGTLTAGAAINLVANVAPGTTQTSGSGSVNVTGSQASSVTVTTGSGGGSGGGTGGGTTGGGSNPVTVPSDAKMAASVSENGGTIFSTWLGSDYTVGSFINNSAETGKSSATISLNLASNAIPGVSGARRDSQAVSLELTALFEAFIGKTASLQATSIAYSFGNGRTLVTYAVSRSDTSSQKVAVATPDSKTGAATLLADIFQGLNITASSSTDNGDIFIPQGAYIAVGTTELYFKNAADIPSVSSGLLTAVTNATTLIPDAVNFATDEVKFYIPKNAVLRIGQTQMTATRNLTITIDGLNAANGPTDSMFSFLYNAVNIPTWFNGKSVSVDISEA